MRVTVVIPLYNGEAFVGRALRSVLSQTHADLDLVVIDDGSTDGGPDEVRRVAGNRARLIRQPNAGVSAARNRGAEEATTEWLAFLDADDEWEPRFVEKTVAMVSRHPDVVAVFSNYLDRCAGVPVIQRGPAEAGVVEDYFRLSLGNGGNAMWTSATLVWKSALLAAGGFPVGITHGEDRDTWARLAWTGPVAYVPEVLAVYHTETPGSAMKQAVPPEARYPSVARTFREWMDAGRIPSHLLESSARLVDHYLLWYADWVTTQAHDPSRARQVLRTECRLPGSNPVAYLKLYARTLLPPHFVRRWDAARRSASADRAQGGGR